MLRSMTIIINGSCCIKPLTFSVFYLALTLNLTRIRLDQALSYFLQYQNNNRFFICIYQPKSLLTLTYFVTIETKLQTTSHRFTYSMMCSQFYCMLQVYWTLTKAYSMCNNRVFILVIIFLVQPKIFIFRLSYDLDNSCSYFE